MDPILAVHGLEKTYGAGTAAPVAALRGVELTVRSGEFVAVVGPSGSGKSTLLHLVGGLDRPSAGEIHVGGRRVDTLNETGRALLRRREIGVVFQAHNLIGNLPVAENVELPALLAGVGPREARRRRVALLSELGLADRWRALPGELSGGEQQRVGVARALVRAFALVAVVLIVSNAAAGRVVARRREIGLLRAVGVTSGGATLLLVPEELALGLLGAVCGRGRRSVARARPARSHRRPAGDERPAAAGTADRAAGAGRRHGAARRLRAGPGVAGGARRRARRAARAALVLRHGVDAHAVAGRFERESQGRLDVTVIADLFAADRDALRPVLAALDAVLLAIALVNLLTTMLLGARERSRDLALLKAVGMTPRQVVAGMAAGAALLACLAVAGGIPLGLLLFHTLVRFASPSDAADITVDPSAAALALLVPGAIALATLAAAVAGRRLAWLPVVQTLREE